MPFCPKCRSDFREGFTVCSDCDVELVDELHENSTIKPGANYSKKPQQPFGLDDTGVPPLPVDRDYVPVPQPLDDSDIGKESQPLVMVAEATNYIEALFWQDTLEKQHVPVITNPIGERLGIRSSIKRTTNVYRLYTVAKDADRAKEILSPFIDEDQCNQDECGEIPLDTCWNCGQWLAETPPLCPFCGSKPIAGDIYCRTCGKELNVRPKFCPKCGVELQDTGFRPSPE